VTAGAVPWAKLIDNPIARSVAATNKRFIVFSYGLTAFTT
jgi:hypothetical protein